jgi:outer membrane protein
MNMKKLFCTLAFLFLLGNSSLFAQRFAYVDTDYIMDMLPDYKSAQKQLDLIAENWQKEAEAMKQEIDKMEKEYQAEQVLLTEELKKKKETEIKAKETELKDFMNKKFGYEGELFKKRQELVKPIQDKVFDACQKIAKQSALDFIFAKGGDRFADEVPEKVLVPVKVCAVLMLATLVKVLSAKVMVLFVRVSTPVKVAKPEAVNAA